MDVPTNHVFSVQKLKAGRHSGFGRAGKAILRYENKLLSRRIMSSRM
jgi:hypothetical protein